MKNPVFHSVNQEFEIEWEFEMPQNVWGIAHFHPARGIPPVIGGERLRAHIHARDYTPARSTGRSPRQSVWLMPPWSLRGSH
jgi:hypothetical protein